MHGKTEILQKTPLHESHIQLGAKMVPFSGWSMPVQYSGIIDEHKHTRNKCGIFDITHMEEFLLSGASMVKDIDKDVTCRIDDMTPGRCRYTFMLNEKGGIIDDLIIYKKSDHEFMFVVNAGCIQKDKEWIMEHISSDTFFTDISNETAKIDVQGPFSGKVLSQLVSEDIAAELKRFHFENISIGDVGVLLSRTGYTGELGFELYLPAENAEEIWRSLLNIDGVKPIGLGARDTLRMEKGYSLYGNDINDKRTPLEANLEKFVFMDKDFIGKKALKQQMEEGVQEVLAAFLCEGRRSARSHFKVTSGGKVIGEVTSGGFSPCLKKGMGLCYINKDFSKIGQEIILTDERIEIKANIEKLPFV